MDTPNKLIKSAQGTLRTQHSLAAKAKAFSFGMCFVVVVMVVVPMVAVAAVGGVFGGSLLGVVLVLPLAQAASPSAVQTKKSPATNSTPSESKKNDGVFRFSKVLPSSTPKQIQDWASAAGDQKNQKVLLKKTERDWQKVLEFRRFRSDPNRRWERGEIESESAAVGLVALVQLELWQTPLRYELSTTKKPLKPSSTHLAEKSATATLPEENHLLEVWGSLFQFASDISYEEASPVGLKLAHAIRALTMDEMEKWKTPRPQTPLPHEPQPQVPLTQAPLTHEQRPQAPLSQEPASKIQERKLQRTRYHVAWAEKLPSPWPIDRMILAQSRRILGERAQRDLPVLIAALQKNPHLSLEEHLKNLRKDPLSALHDLDPLWRKADVELMQAELTRRSRLVLRWAREHFETEFGRLPASEDELVQVGILAQRPLNYSSGKPLVFSE